MLALLADLEWTILATVEDFLQQAKIIRHQLGRWWLRIGSLWLALLLLTSILDIEPLRFQLNTWGSYGSWLGVFFGFDWWRILLLCFWLYAAGSAYSMLARLEQSAAIPRSAATLRARFLLLYLQGIPGLLVCTAGRLFSAWLFYKSLPDLLHIPVVSTGSILRTLHSDVFPPAMAALFLIALLMLAAGKPLFPWLWLATIACAQLLTHSAVYWQWGDYFLLNRSGAIYEFHAWAWTGLVISMALYWGLLLLFSARRRGPAYVLFGVLLALTIGEAALHGLAASAQSPDSVTIPGLIVSCHLPALFPASILANITSQASFLPTSLLLYDKASPGAGPIIMLFQVPVFSMHAVRLAATAVILLNIAWLALLLWLAGLPVSRANPR